MGTAEKFIEAARMDGGTKRSAEYWRGALDVIRYRLFGAPIQCPYSEGTVQFDAYFAGNDRGHVLWRDRQAAEPLLRLVGKGL